MKLFLCKKYVFNTFYDVFNTFYAIATPISTEYEAVEKPRVI